MVEKALRRKKGKAAHAERVVRYAQIEDLRAIIALYEQRIEVMRAEIKAHQRWLNGA